MIEQPGVIVALDRAVVGDRVGVAAVVDHLGHQPVQRLGMAELVLGERAHRHVLLEHRRDPRPLGVAEADDELVIGHREEQQRQRVAGRRNEIGGGPRHPAFPRGFVVPDCSRAAASLSRIT